MSLYIGKMMDWWVNEWHEEQTNREHPCSRQGKTMAMVCWGWGQSAVRKGKRHNRGKRSRNKIYIITLPRAMLLMIEATVKCLLLKMSKLQISLLNDPSWNCPGLALKGDLALVFLFKNVRQFFLNPQLANCRVLIFEPDMNNFVHNKISAKQVLWTQRFVAN